MLLRSAKTISHGPSNALLHSFSTGTVGLARQRGVPRPPKHRLKPLAAVTSHLRRIQDEILHIRREIRKLEEARAPLAADASRHLNADASPTASVATAQSSHGARSQEKQRPRKWWKWSLPLIIFIIVVPANIDRLPVLLDSVLEKAFLRAAPKSSAPAHPEGLKLVVLEPGAGSDPVACLIKLGNELGNPSYECLSYRCGDQTIRKRIKCADRVHTVGPNLFSAMKHLRHSDKQRILWIDELCIDQSDLTEKREQVAMMGDIYSAASRVLVWLGESDNDALHAIETVRLLESFFQRDQLSWAWSRYLRGGKTLDKLNKDPFLQDRDWKPLQRLLENEYFERTWIVQEIAKSRDAVIICGHETLRWTTFINVISSMWGGELLSLLSSVQADQHIDNLQSISGLRDATKINGRAGSLLSIYKLTSKFRCGDPRDRLFGILSMARDVGPFDYAVRPDYDLDLNEVLIRFGKWLIVKRHDLTTLSWSHTADDSQPPTNLPSWVPDNRRLSGASSFNSRLVASAFSQSFSAAGDRPSAIHLDTDGRSIHILGRRITQIKTTGRTPEEFWTVNLNKIASHPEVANNTRVRALIDITRVYAWVTEAYNISPRPLPLSFTDAWSLTRTATCGLSYMGRRISWMDYSSFGQLVADFYKEDVVGNGFSEELESKFTTPGAGIRRTTRAVLLWCKGRRMAVTREEGWACVPETAGVGDVVCLLYGGKVPYVLRAVEGGWRILGECYVDGMMDGEALGMVGGEDEEFVLK